MKIKIKYLIIVILVLIICLNLIPVKENKVAEKSIKEKRAIFISYIELQKYLKEKSETDAKKNIDMMINTLDEFNFNFILLQVRSFSDAIYPSNYYPWSKTISYKEGVAYSFDVLDYFIKKAHQRKIELHAWINPYRIRTTNNIEDISEQNPAYTLLNTNNVYIGEEGIYYNPASNKVQRLILDSIEEILKNYKVDGIHFDDYFYPNLEIDRENYNNYIKTNEEITINDYHLLMVNNLVKKTHALTKKYHVTFGISPEGNIENNYVKNQADIYLWGSNDLYVDYLMPQIYFGFENEASPFYEVLASWNKVVEKSNVKLIPALAFYKIDKVDYYAKKGQNEWKENDDIIMRQILLSRNLKSYEGFSLFRYDSVFGDEVKTEVVNSEIKNLKRAINF